METTQRITRSLRLLGVPVFTFTVTVEEPGEAGEEPRGEEEPGFGFSMVSHKISDPVQDVVMESCDSDEPEWSDDDITGDARKGI